MATNAERDAEISRLKSRVTALERGNSKPATAGATPEEFELKKLTNAEKAAQKKAEKDAAAGK